MGHMITVLRLLLPSISDVQEVFRGVRAGRLYQAITGHRESISTNWPGSTCPYGILSVASMHIRYVACTQRPRSQHPDLTDLACLNDCCIPGPCDRFPYTNRYKHQTIPQCHLYRLWPTNPTGYSLLGPGWRAFLSSTRGLKMFSAGVLNWPRREPV
jgi:hypothetical protein